MESSNESHFHVIDVETANADYSSICQIGVAEFKNGELISTWETLINPEDYFDSINTSIHGISSDMVENSPTFPEITDELQNMIGGKVLFHHMPFDKVAINRTLLKYQLEIKNPIWIDSAKVVRRTWSEYSSSGYGLKSITKSLNIIFKHHNALEDAIATGKVVLKALEKNDWCIEDCLKRIERPINIYKNSSTSIKMDGVPDGPLYGENLVFTGSLFLTRAEAGKLAANLGCNVTNSVTKKTTILIVGTQESFKLNGYQKSSKHRKAEELLLKGGDLRIMSEDDFRDLLNS